MNKINNISRKNYKLVILKFWIESSSLELVVEFEQNSN